MKSILEDIKKQEFRKVYLLYGEETYLRDQYRQKLLDALVTEGDTMNFSRFQGKGRTRERSSIWRRPCLFLPTGG